MKKGIVIAFFTLAACACSSEKTQLSQAEKPAKLMSREDMIKVFMEIHLAESGVSMMGIEHQRAIGLYKQYQTEILKKYKIDTASYRQNYNYYMQSPLEMEYILTIVEDSLIKMQAAAKIKERGGSNMYPHSPAGSQDSVKVKQ
jgi:Domain of unknown function (DUF4296)